MFLEFIKSRYHIFSEFAKNLRFAGEFQKSEYPEFSMYAHAKKVTLHY